MTLGVKYCGGCNPRFQRATVIQRLQKDFPDLELFFLSQQPDKAADFTLVVNGCDAACAAGSVPAGHLGTFSLAREEDYPALAQTLQELLAQRPNG